MQSAESCLRGFPDQCEGCSEYRERRYNLALQLIATYTMGMPYPSHYKNAVVKECKRYHKRKVEPLER